MDAKELRIGNYISRLDLGNNLSRIEKIIALEEMATTTGPIKVRCEYDELSPIPLTKEWFEKNAPCKDEYECYYFQHPTNENIIFYLTDAGFIQEVIHTYDLIIFEHVKTVHQFQNLFFALTNTELTINENSL